MDNKPIKLAFYGIEPRFHKIMDKYFQRNCKGLAVVVDEFEAEIDIIDSDVVEVMEVLEDRRSKTPNRPIILLSLQEQSSDGIIYVKKPVKKLEFLAAINKAYLIVNQHQLENEQVLSAQPSTLEDEEKLSLPSMIESELEKVQKSKIETPSSLIKKKRANKNILDGEEKKKLLKHLKAIRLNEGGFLTYVSVAEEIDFSDINQVLKATFNPQYYFLGYVQSAVNVAKAKEQILQLRSGWKNLIIFPKTHEVWLDADDRQLRAFASIIIKNNLNKGMDLRSVDQETTRLNKTQDRFFDTDVFIWKLAIWTSKGRYPDSIDIDKPVFLKRWPNFTRLVITPHALRITAVLMESPKTLMEVAEILEIKPQYVFVFISAANAVGFVSQAEQKRVKAKVDKIEVPSKSMKSNLKSLFSWMQDKLR